MWGGCEKEQHGEKDMNLALIQRPKKVNASSKTLYIYAPSVLMDGFKLKPESIIKILEVHEGDSPETTTLKVITNDAWAQHTTRWYGDSSKLCTKTKERRGLYGDNETRPECGCEKPLDEMPDELRSAVHYVLLSDIGK